MPKKKNEPTQKAQARPFRDAVQGLVDAGELNPTEADERFERAMGKIVSSPTKNSD